MESKICTQCNIEKHINNFYKKYSECKDCNIKRGVKRYTNTNVISKQINFCLHRLFLFTIYRTKVIFVQLLKPLGDNDFK